ncbi:MAG: HU family DNA-binding protein [Myxococcota bacterium]
MRKSELVEFASKGVETTKKDVEKIVDRVFDAMKKEVKKEGKFAYPHFGSLVLRKRKARQGRDPRTGETIRIKASKTVAFRPASAFKEAL